MLLALAIDRFLDEFTSQIGGSSQRIIAQMCIPLCHLG
jgi:hypothetical protein